MLCVAERIEENIKTHRVPRFDERAFEGTAVCVAGRKIKNPEIGPFVCCGLPKCRKEVNVVCGVALLLLLTTTTTILRHSPFRSLP